MSVAVPPTQIYWLVAQRRQTARKRRIRPAPRVPGMCGVVWGFKIFHPECGGIITGAGEFRCDECGPAIQCRRTAARSITPVRQPSTRWVRSRSGTLRKTTGFLAKNDDTSTLGEVADVIHRGGNHFL